jgi:hypothetical protein
MNRVLITHKFDPELHPIGYALTLVFLGEEAPQASPGLELMSTSTAPSIHSDENLTPQHDHTTSSV